MQENNPELFEETLDMGCAQNVLLEGEGHNLTGNEHVEYIDSENLIRIHTGDGEIVEYKVFNAPNTFIIKSEKNFQSSNTTYIAKRVEK